MLAFRAKSSIITIFAYLCGEEIDLEARFCSKCGKELGYIKENESQDRDE